MCRVKKARPGASVKAVPTFSFASLFLKARESTLSSCTMLTVPCPCLGQSCDLRGCTQGCDVGYSRINSVSR